MSIIELRELQSVLGGTQRTTNCADISLEAAVAARAKYRELNPAATPRQIQSILRGANNGTFRACVKLHPSWNGISGQD